MNRFEKLRAAFLEKMKLSSTVPDSVIERELDEVIQAAIAEQTEIKDNEAQKDLS
jgi:hypothetical protein